MFTVSDAEAAAIRQAYEQSGELAAAVELRRLFPGITDNTVARDCVRMIVSWPPPSAEPPAPPRPKRKRSKNAPRQIPGDPRASE
jgi:hypothetical protein